MARSNSDFQFGPGTSGDGRGKVIGEEMIQNSGRNSDPINYLPLHWQMVTSEEIKNKCLESRAIMVATRINLGLTGKYDINSENKTKLENISLRSAL